jgi:hypothetical protein
VENKLVQIVAIQKEMIKFVVALERKSNHSFLKWNKKKSEIAMNKMA